MRVAVSLGFRCGIHSPAGGLRGPTDRSGAPVAVGNEVESAKTTRTRARSSTRNGAKAEKNGADREITRAELEQLLAALEAARDGEFQVRLPVAARGIAADLNRAFNELAERREALS